MVGREKEWECLAGSDYGEPRDPGRGVRRLWDSHWEMLEVCKQRWTFCILLRVTSSEKPYLIPLMFSSWCQSYRIPELPLNSQGPPRPRALWRQSSELPTLCPLVWHGGGSSAQPEQWTNGPWQRTMAPLTPQCHWKMDSKDRKAPGYMRSQILNAERCTDGIPELTQRGSLQGNRAEGEMNWGTSRKPRKVNENHQGN